MFLVLLLFALNPAAAQSVGPLDPGGAARPSSLEGLVADLGSDLKGNRSYANRELLRRIRLSRRALRKPDADDFRTVEARIDLADQRAQVGPAAAMCLSAYPTQAGSCARLLGALADPRWTKTLEQARPKASKRARKRIDAALKAIAEYNP